MQFTFQERELETIGIYPSVGTNYGDPIYPVEKLNTPITPKENMRRFFEHEPLCWVPNPEADYNIIYPECVPDCFACKYEGGIDSFGVRWIPVTNNPMLPSFVDPECRILSDISQWREMEWPDVESWDWKAEARIYKNLDPDRMRKGIMITGFFERLIAVMGFENAATSLIEDSEEVEAFMDALLLYNKQVMQHYHDDLRCDVILFHDDWSAQYAPFFSLDTVMKLIVPRLKELVDYCHSLNMYFIHHSCGNGSLLLPAYLATGADAWQIQLDAVRDQFCEMIEQYGDQLLWDTYIIIEDPDEEQAKQYVDRICEEYGSSGKVALNFIDVMPETRSIDFRKYCYEAARLCINR